MLTMYGLIKMYMVGSIPYKQYAQACIVSTTLYNNKWLQFQTQDHTKPDPSGVRVVLSEDVCSLSYLTDAAVTGAPQF